MYVWNAIPWIQFTNGAPLRGTTPCTWHVMTLRTPQTYFSYKTFRCSDDHESQNLNAIHCPFILVRCLHTSTLFLRTPSQWLLYSVLTAYRSCWRKWTSGIPLQRSTRVPEGRGTLSGKEHLFRNITEQSGTTCHGGKKQESVQQDLHLDYTIFKQKHSCLNSCCWRRFARLESYSFVARYGNGREKTWCISADDYN